jgi:adenylylsulfate kinase
MTWAIWITGVPGSGKSSIARAAVELLRAEGEPVTRLSLDDMRRVVTPAPTYSERERALVYRGLVWVAACLSAAAVPVIIDATAHRREWRQLARRTITRFAEVQLECPLPVCREREARRQDESAPRAIYAAAGRSGATVPGVDVPYERAIAAELTVDTAVESVEQSAARVVELARTLDGVTLPDGDRGPAWAIWITGLPGSGKTTIAARVLEALEGEEPHAQVLEPDAVRRFVLGGRRSMGHEEDIIHRTLVYAAKRLTEAGAPVIVDATAPRRHWRDMARELISPFAEVQLLCPRDVCATRERAIRWHLAGSHGRPGWTIGTGVPDIVLDYEGSLQPQLVIHTDIEDPWTAAESVMLLARRLRGAATQRGEPTWQRHKG